MCSKIINHNNSTHLFPRSNPSPHHSGTTWPYIPHRSQYDMSPPATMDMTLSGMGSLDRTRSQHHNHMVTRRGQCRNRISLNCDSGSVWLLTLVPYLKENQKKKNNISINEPCHEIMVLFVLRKIILQMHMRSNPVGLDVWFLIGPFVYFYTSCARTVKALSRLRGCVGSPEPSLDAYVISTIISWAGPLEVYGFVHVSSNQNISQGNCL